MHIWKVHGLRSWRQFCNRSEVTRYIYRCYVRHVHCSHTCPDQTWTTKKNECFPKKIMKYNVSWSCDKENVVKFSTHSLNTAFGNSRQTKDPFDNSFFHHFYHNVKSIIRTIMTRGKKALFFTEKKHLQEMNAFVPFERFSIHIWILRTAFANLINCLGEISRIIQL